jgi:uncharacterized iron-regulated membrane protein
MSVRKILFWAHLTAGVIAGLAIGIMCFTGTVLAFEKELVAWSENDARRIASPAADAPRLSLEEMQRQLRAAKPDARPQSAILQNDPTAAVAFAAGRSGTYYVNPYTGEVRQPKFTQMATLMRTMVEWHRYLGFSGEVSRPRGKLINGICNIAFCVLAITGLYLWMPRTWSWRALRPTVWFTQNQTSKARDWNWHNVIGFWSAPILIVLTLTAMPISFRWAGSMLYTLTGTELPATGPQSSGAPGAPVDVPTPAPGVRPISVDTLLATVQQHLPNWKTITVRFPSPPTAASANASAARLQPTTFTVRETNSWPRTATTTVSMDPFTGAILKSDGYADLSAARKARAWTRFLHTGEAVGWIGQLLAGIASLGGLILTWTGLALAWRRFFGRTPPTRLVPVLAKSDTDSYSAMRDTR